jgi:lipopolysaccharide transport system ATP-binding protein
MKPILEIRGISKKYNITHEGKQPYLSLRDSINNIFKKNKSSEEFWALRNISFDVYPGDSIAIIGKNGAGKSTLLKILSKITSPTEGKIISRGRIASLLEVGTGFHPELTGKENIYLNGSILGLKRKEIEKHFEAIVDFSGVERFLDTPLKHYSSGMQLRLAFAVAAHLEPEILIIDEVLAVGDAEFQKKCMGKMNEVSKSGRTILFVSHNLGALENLCTKAFLLQNGELKKEGDVTPIIKEYQKIFSEELTHRWTSEKNNLETLFFKSIEIKLQGKQPSYKLLIQCLIKSGHPHKDAFIAFDISNSINVTILQAIPVLEPFIKYKEEESLLKFEIDLPPLIPDTYKVSAWLGPHNTETFVWEKDIVKFEIYDTPTPGRNFPHAHNNGFIVPYSRVLNI